MTVIRQTRMSIGEDVAKLESAYMIGGKSVMVPQEGKHRMTV